MILIVSTDYEVALAFYRFLSRSLEGSFRVQLDCLPTPDFFGPNIQNDNILVISSSTSIEWMAAYLDKREVIDCWIIEPYRSILSRIYNPAFIIDYFEEYVARFAQVHLPKSRWIRLPECCMNDVDIISLVQHLISGSSTLDVARVLEAYRLELSQDLARLSPAPAVRGIALDVTYQVCSTGIGGCFLGAGWFPPEQAHTWSHGDKAFIVLPLHPRTTQGLVCYLDLTFMTINTFLQIKCNDKDVYSIFIDIDASRREVSFPVSPIYQKDQPCIFLELVTNAMRPKDLDPSSVDDRQIGVGLRTIRVENFSSSTESEGHVPQIDRPHASFIQYIGIKKSFGTVLFMKGVNSAKDNFLGVAFESCLLSGSHSLRCLVETSAGLRQILIVEQSDRSQTEFIQLASDGNKQVFRSGLSAALHWLKKVDRLIDYAMLPSFDDLKEFIEKIDLCFPGRSSGKIVDVIYPPPDLNTDQKEWLSRHFNKVTFSRSQWRMYR